MTKVRYEISMSGAEELTGDVELKHCPFCGSEDLELTNTHTPSCWVECLDCQAQAHGECFQNKNGFWREGHFKKAIQSAVSSWNRRAA